MSLITNSFYSQTPTTNNFFGSGNVVLSGSISVTGSNPILSPNFSGIGGAQVILSGSTILISGGAGGSGPVSASQVNMSFYFDENNLSTGLNVVETFVSKNFYLTGYALGLITSGTQGFFTGSFYQRNQINTKTNFINFSLNSGILFYASGGLSQPISGLNRFGLDIYNVGSGMTGLSIGIFGFDY